jgi:hypothetical protein
MKINKLFNVLLFSLIFLLSCGKPNDPESIKPIEPEDKTGGYKIVKKLATAGYAQDVTKKDSLLYIAQGEGGMMIINVIDPENPVAVSITTENLQGYSYKIAIVDSIAYLAAGSNGVFVVDISDPFAPFRLEVSSPYKPARNFHIMGEYMFVAISENGLKISDILYPSEPDPRGGIQTAGYAMGLTTTADSAYLMAACGEMGLSVFNISDFQEGYGDYPLVGTFDTPGYAEAVIISEEKSVAFLACGTAGLQIIDYSDTTNIHIAGAFDGGGYAKTLLLKNNKIFLTAELGGLQIIDVSDVTTPKLLGQVETEKAMGLAMDNDYIYVADEVEGIIVVSIPK